MNGVNFFDGTVMAFIQEHFHNAFTDAVLPVITYLGEYGAFWIVLSLLLLCAKKTRRCGLFMLFAMACGFLTGEVILKNVVCRPRPFHMFPEYTTLLIPPPSGWSFPSGHSCSSFAAAAVLCCHSRKWGIPALILAGLITFSRVFLFVHWPLDALAGALLGTAFALLIVIAAKKWKERKTPSPQE